MLANRNRNRVEGWDCKSPYEGQKQVLPQDLWIPQGIEEEREDKTLQDFCYKARHKTEELELEDMKERENHLPDSLASVANRSKVLVLSLRDGVRKGKYKRNSG